MQRNIWIVDDEPAICWALRKAMEGQGYVVNVFSSAETFLHAIVNDTISPEVVFMDVRLPGISGIETLNRLQQSHPQLPVVLMTAFGDLKIAVDAVKNKAFEYLTKPFALETALHAAERAFRIHSSLQDEASDELDLSVDAVLGRAAVMQDVYKQIALAASNDWPVLISGEQGVGKSIVARFIHQYGKRREHPLLTFRPNPDDPIECLCELYGFDLGANLGVESGAEKSLQNQNHLARLGLLRLAGSGSVVVDEATLLPLSVQTRLLESLESQTFVALSSNRHHSLAARLIFTTSSKWDASLLDDELYPQFYSHLQIHKIHIPTLAEHREDIPLLVRAALQQPAFGGPLRITDRAMHELKQRPWRGNIRELNQVLQKAAVKAGASLIDLDDLPPPAYATDGSNSHSEVSRELDLVTRRWLNQHLADDDDPASPAAERKGFLYEQCVEVVERAMISATLENTQGNRALAAEYLGLHRTTLRQKAKRLGIE